jgi:hypothetical protein
MVEIWKTDDAMAQAPKLLMTVPGPFECRRLVEVLAQNDVGLSLDPDSADEVVVEGVEGFWAEFLVASLVHYKDADGKCSALALLTLEPQHLVALTERHKNRSVPKQWEFTITPRRWFDYWLVQDISELLSDAARLPTMRNHSLAQLLTDSQRGDEPSLEDLRVFIERGDKREKATAEARVRWLAKWARAVDEELQRQLVSPLTSAEPENIRSQAIRAWIEAHLCSAGCLPAGEYGLSPKSHEDDLGGAAHATEASSSSTVEDSVGRFEVQVYFVTPDETVGDDAIASEAGWYFAVLNPDSEWRFNDPEGPYLSPDHAWSEASNLEGIGD